jgi:hypothetical protein
VLSITCGAAAESIRSNVALACIFWVCVAEPVGRTAMLPLMTANAGIGGGTAGAVAAASGLAIVTARESESSFPACPIVLWSEVPELSSAVIVEMSAAAEPFRDGVWRFCPGSPGFVCAPVASDGGWFAARLPAPGIVAASGG